jgi:heme A synthase
VFLAGVGVFGINALKVANASSFNAHRDWGAVLELTALVLLILALVARESGRTMISALVLALLAVIAQNALAGLGDSNKWFGGLHALDGIVILLLSVWIALLAWRRQHSR